MKQATMDSVDRSKLAEAALRNLHVDCQVAGDQGFSCRMLHMNEERLLLSAPSCNGGNVAPKVGEVLTCTCRLGQEILRFEGFVEGTEEFQLNPQMRVRALRVTNVKDMSVVQHRRYYRVSLAGRHPMEVTLWPVRVDASGKATVEGEFHGQIADLSAGGMGVLVSGEGAVEAMKAPQLWARFMLPGENESLILRVGLRHQVCIGRNGTHLAGLEIMEHIDPGQGTGILDSIASFVAQEQRAQSSQRKDK